jgi:hypothetical protein
MKAMSRDKFLILAALATAGLAALSANAGAQGSEHVHPGMADHAMSGPMNANMLKHMELTPVRSATRADTARARALVAELKPAIAKYRDTAAAVADGYQMFLPNVKNQRVYHFTNYKRALKEAFRFDAAQPTSLLYRREASGKLVLIGAMYTMPKNTNPSRLGERVPLGIARWHKHVNWCLPKKSEQARFGERLASGMPKFGPESPIATRAECDAVAGEFHRNLFGWMLHANVFDGDDLGKVFDPH